MLLSRRAYVGLSHEGARALGDRRAGAHQGIAALSVDALRPPRCVLG